MSTAAFITLVANVGRIDATRTFNDDRQLGSFSAAVSRRFKVKGEAAEETDWYTVKATSAHLIDMIENRIGVGDQLIIAGAVSLKQFTRNDGSKGMSVEIYAHDIRYNISKKTDGAATGQGQAGPAQEDLDDEIPF